MIEIKEVKTKKEMKQYIRFQNELYAGVENYIPTLLEDEMMNMDVKRNPGYEYCDSKSFLAYKDGKIVGRITAIHNKAYNDLWKFKRMRFTRFDVIDDIEVTKALFDAVTDWAKELGLNEIIGPIGFCDLDKEGMLVEGFDQEGLFITFYNHPYYIDHLTQLGFVKEADWIEYKIKVDKINERVRKLSGVVKRRFKLTPVKIKKKSQIKGYLKQIFGLLNEAYKPLFGVVPLSGKQINMYASQYMPIIDLNLVSLVYNEEEKLVGFGLAIPNMNKAVKAAKGRLYPFGFISLFRELKRTDVLDLLLIAVHPDYQGKGVNAIILDELQDYVTSRFKYAETGPELELNEKIQAQWDGYEYEQHKRRRCFKKEI